jgi:hypothetical protein
VLLGTQEPSLLLRAADEATLDAGIEATDLAQAYGVRLDLAQRIALEVGMALTAEGKWAAQTVGHAVPRQNGKGDVIQWRELYGAVVLNERIAHTAHEVGTAKEAFKRMEGFIQSHPDLRALVAKITYGNGDWAITFKSQSFIIYRTRTNGGLRGYDEIDLLIVDEAQHCRDEHLAAITPTQAVSANPQTWFAGSPGLSSSDVWWRMRLQAIRGEQGPWAWIEHTSERCMWDERRGRVVSAAPAAEDEHGWALSNPAYGFRIGGGGAGSRRYFMSQLIKLGEPLFLREHCGVWDPMAGDEGVDPKLPQDEWERCTTLQPPPQEVGAVVFGVDVHDGWGAVVAATGRKQSSFVEVVEYDKGDGWIPARIVKAVADWEPIAVVFDGTNGESLAVLGATREALEEAGLDPDVIRVAGSREAKQACADFLHAVTNETVKRPKLEHDQLFEAGRIAPARVVGDAWVWDRVLAPRSIAALAAATWARSGLGDGEAFWFY